MINNRLKIWSQKHVLEDWLVKSPNTHPYKLSKENKFRNLSSGIYINSLRIKNPVYNLNFIMPKAIKINVCSSKAVTDKRKLIPILLALELIIGQRGLLTKAKYSLATFRLKKGMHIGVKITLKRYNMWNFFDKLIHIIFPSLIYFNKLKNNRISYDKWGNLAIGLEDISIFPELNWLRTEGSKHPLFYSPQGLGVEPKALITGADILIVV